ncbi:MAG: tripartite tricarboxylate transporter substrate binding protein, partial [Pseudomonadota bacterium]
MKPVFPSASFAAVLLAAASAAQAQPAPNWPSRPMRIVVGFVPGGPVDLVARIVAPRYSALLG